MKNYEDFLRLSRTALARIFTAKSISSKVFTHPKLKRNEELILERGKRIAERTFEGIPVPELHADPVETDIPSISNAIINASPSAPSNPQLKVFGR